MQDQRYADAHNLLNGPTCPRIMVGTTVRGPFKKETIKYPGGQGLDYFQVGLPDGRKVWMLDADFEMDGR